METYKGIKVTADNKRWIEYMAKMDAKEASFNQNLKAISQAGYSSVGNVLALLATGLMMVIAIAIPIILISLVF